MAAARDNLFKPWTIMMIVGMLLTGTVNTLTMKILFTIKSIDSTGHEALFKKPWFGTLNMLLAMFLVGVVDKIYRMTCAASEAAAVPDVNPIDEKKQALVPKDAEGSAEKAEEMPEKKVRSYTYKVVMVSAPAFMDLLATAFACIGIMYIPASIWQMLRGACIIFSALFSITFLRSPMYGFNWLGLFVVIVGVVSVGYAGVLSNAVEAQVPSGNASNVAGDDAEAGGATGIIFGMAMVLLGQIFQAAQVVAEEFLMKDVDLPAMQIIGWEGVWGTLMMLVLVYPALWEIKGADHGHYEDAWDTWVMLTNSWPLVQCFLVYLTSCATFNATGIAVTGELSAVHRMMLDASRTTVIWAFGLFVHTYNPDALYSEAWTVYSPLQLVGFLVLVAGQAIYGQVLLLPCKGLYPPAEERIVTPAAASPSAGLSLLPLGSPVRKAE